MPKSTSVTWVEPWWGLIVPLAGVPACGAPEPPDLGPLDARLDGIEVRLGAIEAQLARETPRSPPHASSEGPRRVTVELDADQTLVDGEVVADIALRSRIEVLAARYPDATVTVRAGPSVSFERTTNVLGTLRAAGLQRFALVAEEPASDTLR